MPMTIRTERLVMEALGGHHAAGFLSLWDDPDSMRFLGGALDAPQAWARLARFAGQWSLHGFGHYALLTRSGEFQGYAGLWFPHGWPEIEVGYALHPAGHGRGYASEAVRAIRAVASQRGVPSLVSYIDPRNVASQRVAEAAGAQADGSVELRRSMAEIWRYPVDPSAEAAEVDASADVLWEASAMPLEIRTPRLRLTQWRLEHFDRFAAHAADPVSMRFTGGAMDAEEAWRDMAAAAGQWALRGYGVYAVEADGVVIGGVGLLHPFGWPERELAWSLAADARGRGYATEAARAVRAVAAVQGASRLVSLVHADNVASRRVAERLGAWPGGTAELFGEPVTVFVHPMDLDEAASAEDALLAPV